MLASWIMNQAGRNKRAAPVSGPASRHPNVDRVQAALRAAGSSAEVRELAGSTRTADEAATALGVEVAQIAKSLVFLADAEPVVVVASGADRVDTAALGRALGGKRITRADAEVVRAATGYPIGGVSPVGLPAGPPVLVERALDRHETVYAAAGTPYAVFRTTYDELLRLTGGEPSDVRVLDRTGPPVGSAGLSCYFAGATGSALAR